MLATPIPHISTVYFSTLIYVEAHLIFVCISDYNNVELKLCALRANTDLKDSILHWLQNTFGVYMYI